MLGHQEWDGFDARRMRWLREGWEWMGAWAWEGGDGRRESFYFLKQNTYKYNSLMHLCSKSFRSLSIPF